MPSMVGWSMAHRAAGNDRQRVLLRDWNLMMLGAEAAGNFPRILPFVELLFLEYQREGVRAHAIVAEDGNQSAGIDSARKKHSDGHVTHQVRQHRIAQDRGQLSCGPVP